MLTEGLGYSAEEAGEPLGIKGSTVRALRFQARGSPSYTFNDHGRRRDRKRRSQRITAGVVGIAVFVTAVWLVTTAGSFDRTTTPADEPTVNPADTAKEVALGFLDAYAAFDAKKAMTYVADVADLT